MTTITAQISALFQHFTPVQQQVARFIHENAGQIAFLNASQLAESIGVSNAAVSRFVRRLGYPDFASFREALAAEVIADFSTAKRLEDSARQAKERGVLDSILPQDVANIQDLRANLNRQAFEQAVFSLCRARRIYILGLRSTYALAYYLAFYLRFFLDNVGLIELGKGNYTDEVVGANSEDVLVSISFKRYTRQTVELQQSIRGMGPTVIGISDSDLSPIAASADISLTAQPLLPSYFESFTAPMSLINAILAAVAVQMQSEALPVLNRLETILDALNIYY
jgi:DNA-binding MurR/RpiR family transcriptional regulator